MLSVQAVMFRKYFQLRIYRLSIQLGMLAATFLVRFSNRLINIARRYFEQTLFLNYKQFSLREILSFVIYLLLSKLSIFCLSGLWTPMENQFQVPENIYCSLKLQNNTGFTFNVLFKWSVFYFQ